MHSLLKQFTQREAHPAIQFIKYGIAGGVATAVNIVLFYVCAWQVLPALNPADPVVTHLHLHVGAITDAVRGSHARFDNYIAFVFANLVAYLLNIYWVFKPGRHHPVIEIALFYAVSGVSMVIGTGLMEYLIKHYGLVTTVAFGANLVTALLINYGMRKFVIFKG